MKLAPDNMPWKALVASGIQETGCYFDLGDVNDKKALTVFVKGDFIHNSNNETVVLEASLDQNYKLSGAYFRK